MISPVPAHILRWSVVIHELVLTLNADIFWKRRIAGTNSRRLWSISHKPIYTRLATRASRSSAWNDWLDGLAPELGFLGFYFLSLIFDFLGFFFLQLFFLLLYKAVALRGVGNGQNDTAQHKARALLGKAEDDVS